MALKTFTWAAPSQRVDGTPLTPDELVYKLYINGDEFANFPGTLNPDGEYEFKREFPHGDYVAELTAVDRNHPELESAKSNQMTFTVRAVPNPPTNLRVE